MHGENPETVNTGVWMAIDRVCAGGGALRFMTAIGKRTKLALLSCCTALTAPAVAVAQEVKAGVAVLGMTLGSLEVIQFSMFAGAMGAALLAAVWLIRERGKTAEQNSALRGRIADLTADLERSDLLLASRDSRIAVWDSANSKVDLIGSIPADSGVPQDRAHFLAFGRWLEAGSATSLDRALAALRDRGVVFEVSLRTITGQEVEALGRRTGTISFVRFTGLSSLSAENARLKREHEDLAKTHSLFVALVENLPFPAWQREPDGTLAWTNKAYLATLDKDRGRDAGRDKELFGTQARELIERKRLADGNFKDRVSTVIGSDRSVFDVIDVSGAGGSMGLANDVTAQDALREEFERTLQAQSDTLNQLTTAVAIFDANQKLRSFNSAFQKLWDLELGFLESAPEHGLLLDRLRADSKLPEQPDWRRWREQVLGSYRAPESSEDWWYLPDGKSLRVLVNPQPKGGAIWVFENMTEKMDLESRYNTLIRIQGETLENLSEGVAVFGSDGKLRLFNPAFAALWALPAEMAKEGVHISAIRAACRDLAPHGEWDQFVGRSTGFDDARDVTNGRIELASGSVLAYALAPLPKGQTMLTFFDVSDSVHIERALKDRNDALRKADLLKNDFIQHVFSYELRSPLTNIIGFTELLQQPTSGPLTERQSDYLDHIAVSSSTLLTTVNDILDLATVDAGIMDLDVSDVEIPALFSAVEKQFGPRLAEAGLTTTKIIAPDATILKGDSQRLRQIIGNLVANAVAHGPEGSTVTLSARRDGDAIILAVQDEGAGIAKEQLRQVFDRFVALPSGGKRGGAGLGLSIVKGLVELHHGTVAIRSGNGEGTLVECRLPADPTTARIAAE